MTRTSALPVIIIILAFLSSAQLSHASSTDGIVDAALKYAWSNNVGWINFATNNGSVHITDTALTGYAWSANYGWINLAPTNGGVTNNGEGVLGGFAWGSALGWVAFSGVTIDSAGHFHGAATGSLIGTLTFDCTNCAVVTDWRPISVRTPPPPPASGGGGGGGGGGVISGPLSVGAISGTPGLPSTGGIPTTTTTKTATVVGAPAPSLPNFGSFQQASRVFVSWTFVNIRKSPSLKGPLLGKARAKTQGALVGVPVEKDGYIWVHVQYQNGQTGWSVVEGLSVSPPFKIGNQVRTTQKVNVRKGAGIHERLLRSKAQGSMGLLVGGPVEKDGYTWWQIQYGSTLTGWTADIGLTPAP